jgi:Heterokaryon incompatibility protein (HET)
MEEYEYLRLDVNEIRILEILPGEDSEPVVCQLKHFFIDELPTYSALSYTWGDELTSEFVLIDGKRLGIKPNLDAALREFRRTPVEFETADTEEKSMGKFPALEYHGTSLIWIDAICINQKSNEERNAQVKLMKEIYKRANGLVVWLGTESSDSSLAFSVLRQYIAEGFQVFNFNLPLLFFFTERVPKPQSLIISDKISRVGCF